MDSQDRPVLVHFYLAGPRLGLSLVSTGDDRVFPEKETAE